MLLTAGELISKSYRLYRDNFFTYVKYILLTLIPGLLAIPAVLIITTLFAISFKTVSDKGGEGGAVAISIILALVIIAAVLVIILLAFWFQIAFLKTMYRLVTAQSVVSVGQSLREAWAVVWRGLGTTVLVTLYVIWPMVIAVLLGTMLFSTSSPGTRLPLGIIAGTVFAYSIFHLIYFSVKFGFAFYHAIFAGAKARESMAVSRSMVQNRWWGTFWRFFAPGLLAMVIIIGFRLLLQGGLWLTEQNVFLNLAVLVVFGLASWIAQLLLSPFPPTTYVMFYQNAKENPPTAAPAT